MDFMILANNLNFIGKLIYNNLFGFFEGLNIDSNLIGAFGITVIVFTLIVKVITMPFDVWQKVLARKSTRLMKKMKPELDKITKQCGTDRQMLMVKQQQLYKKYGYSAFSSCIPMIISLVVFMVVFGGFNSAVRFHNLEVYEELRSVYLEVQTETNKELTDLGGMTQAEIMAESTKRAEEAVINTYKPEKFLFTKNIFMPDNWSSPVPTAENFTGKGIGKLGIEGIDAKEYRSVMKPLIEKYNVSSKGGKVWNGYLVLPVLSFLFSILSNKLIKPAEQPAVAGQTEEQQKMAAQQQKMMTYMMPIMMCVFTLFYSTAFTIYYVLSNVVTLLFNLIYNIIAKKQDAIKEEEELRTTIKK